MRNEVKHITTLNVGGLETKVGANAELAHIKSIPTTKTVKKANKSTYEKLIALIDENHFIYKADMLEEIQKLRKMYPHGSKFSKSDLAKELRSLEIKRKELLKTYGKSKVVSGYLNAYIDALKEKAYIKRDIINSDKTPNIQLSQLVYRFKKNMEDVKSSKQKLDQSIESYNANLKQKTTGYLEPSVIKSLRDQFKEAERKGEPIPKTIRLNCMDGYARIFNVVKQGNTYNFEFNKFASKELGM